MDWLYCGIPLRIRLLPLQLLWTVRFGYYSQDGLKFDEQMKVIDVVQDIAEVIELVQNL